MSETYVIKMLACRDVPEGYYGDPGRAVSMNREIYCRVPDAADAFKLKRAEAIRFVMNAKWPCKCEPPLTLIL